jgi:hypothetical protein
VVLEITSEEKTKNQSKTQGDQKKRESRLTQRTEKNPSGKLETKGSSKYRC